VVPTIDVVAVQGELLIVMEYVRGDSLSRLLRAETSRDRRVPLSIASAIAIGALHGLHAAHEATSDRGTPLGIVHRDVSPQNILVGTDGVARVIDFGVAKAAGRLQTTSEGAVKGKIAYMAPEQLAAGDRRLASGEVTRAADIYAMGAVLWEMLNGRRLFTGDGDVQLVLQVLMGVSDPPSRYTPNLSPAIDELVMRALALHPTHRFATAKDMAEALLRVIPPAFPTDVGTWVEEAAHEALARRGTQLAEIESSSDLLTVPSPDEQRIPHLRTFTPATPFRTEPASARTASDEVPTVASQPSSMSLETPRRAPTSPRRSRGAIAVIAGGVVLAGGIAVIAWRGMGAPATEIEPSVEVATAQIQSAALTPSAAITPSAASASARARAPDEQAAPTAEAPAPIVVHAAAPSTPEAPRAAPPPKPRAKPRTAPAPTKASAPFRFAQPD